MLKKVNKKYLIVAVILVLVLLLLLFILSRGNVRTKKVNSDNKVEKYKYFSELIYDDTKIIKLIADENITDGEMEKIYDKYNKQNENCKIWIYKTEEDATNLESYNVAEIKKENNQYKIHRYGEETEEERAIRLEQERIAKEEEEKRKAEEERARKEKEEADFKANCSTYTYKEMARNPDSFKGTNVKLTGEVIQAIYGDISTELRVNITKEGTYSTWYTDTIYVIYYPEEGEGKILEDDIITLWGTSQGDISYVSTIGATITLPCVYAKYVTINE